MAFLSTFEHSKNKVDVINEYFDKGYEIENILDAKCGYYIILVLKGNENCDYAKKYKYNLIEEKNDQWVTDITKKDVKLIYS